MFIRSFSDHSEESCLGITVAALTMRVCRIEIDRIALTQNDHLFLENELNAALQHEVEFLTGMGDEFSRLICRFKRNKERLHDLVRIAECQILETISGDTAYSLSLPASYYLISVYTTFFAGNQFVEIDFEFVGDLIDDAYRKISVLLIADI